MNELFYRIVQNSDFTKAVYIGIIGIFGVFTVLFLFYLCIKLLGFIASGKKSNRK